MPHLAAPFKMGLAQRLRSILRETATRQADQANGDGRLDPAAMRKFLRELAWSMYSRSVDSMLLEDVYPLAKEFFPGHDENALTECERAPRSALGR
jgi:hypothetical protein